MADQPKFVIFAHNATYDKLHQVATLGLTAAAMGKDVIVVLLFWTIKKLAEGKIDHIDFPPEYADSAEEVTRLLKEKRSPQFLRCFMKPVSSGNFASSPAARDSNIWEFKRVRSNEMWMKCSAFLHSLADRAGRNQTVHLTHG